MKTPKMLPWLAHKAGLSAARAEALWAEAVLHASQVAHGLDAVEHNNLAVSRLLELIEAEKETVRVPSDAERARTSGAQGRADARSLAVFADRGDEAQVRGLGSEPISRVLTGAHTPSALAARGRQRPRCCRVVASIPTVPGVNACHFPWRGLSSRPSAACWVCALASLTAPPGLLPAAGPCCLVRPRVRSHAHRNCSQQRRRAFVTDCFSSFRCASRDAILVSGTCSET